MDKLLVAVRQDVIKRLDTDFDTIDNYYDLIGKGYAPIGEIIEQIRKFVNPPEDSYGYVDNYIQPLKDQYREIMAYGNLRGDDEAIGSVLEIVKNKCKRRKKEDQEQILVFEKEKKGYEQELQLVRDKIQELEADKARITSQEILPEIGKKIKELQSQKEQLKEKISPLLKPENIQSEGVEIMKAISQFKKILTPYYDLAELSMNKIRSEESKAYRFLEEVLAGMIPDSYLQNRFSELVHQIEYSQPPSNWEEILSDIIGSDKNLWMGVFVFWGNLDPSHKNYSLIFGEETAPDFVIAEGEVKDICDEINLFRLSLQEVIKKEHVSIISHDNVLLRMAEGIGLKLRFREVQGNFAKGNGILYQIRSGRVRERPGTWGKNDSERVPIWEKWRRNDIFSGYSSAGFYLPNGLYLFGRGFLLEATFKCSPLLINSLSSAQIVLSSSMGDDD